MMLLDTNIFLEIILEQEKAKKAQSFIMEKDARHLFLSDFALHSIGVILFSRRIGRKEMYSEFIEDVIINGGIQVLPLSHLDGDLVVESAGKFDMDFDDAYQYTVCKKYNLDIVTFNRDDFVETDLTVITP